jgi:SAM-dependent methyltransferase
LLGTKDIAPAENDLDLVLASDGAFLEHCTHARRRFAAEQALRRLRPGGIFVIDAPNMPWVLRYDPDPVPRTIVYFDALVSRITDRTLDFDAGTMILRDTFVAEVEDAPTIEWQAERRLALIGLPEVRLALEEAGFSAFGTFTDLAATAPGYVRGRRLLLVAAAP